MPIKNKKVIAIIVARLSSSRMPEKHFRHIFDKPLISWILSELRKSKYIDRITIATTDRSEDDRLYSFAMQEKIDCYRYNGNIDDVTKRIRKASENYQSDIVVTISGDCPLIYAATIDNMLEKLMEAETDICDTAIKNGKKCIHEGIGVMTVNAWRKLDDLSTEPFYQEHPGSYLRDHPDEFSLCFFEDDDIFYEINHRISVDTIADVEFMNSVFSILDSRRQQINLPNVIKLLKQQPELMNINKHVYQKKVFDKTKKILIRLDGGKGIGFGHLMREITVAKKLMESYGAGIRFLVNDDISVKKILTKHGLTFFAVPRGIRREDETGIIKNLKKEFGFHLIVLDLNGIISTEYLTLLKLLGVPIISIDNISEGACLADINIFPVAHLIDEIFYGCKITEKIYNGPDYVIIDDKFHVCAKSRKKSFAGGELNVLITFGGTDPNNLTERVVRALTKTDLPVKLGVVIGPAFETKDQLENLSRKYKDKITLYKDTDDLSCLMSTADIAFTAVGMTIYELTYMGVPSIIIANYEQDKKFLDIFEKLGISLPLGYHINVEESVIINAVEKFVNDKNLLQTMSLNGQKLIDGHGAKRIADIIIKNIVLSWNNKTID